jgi:hypothetical protein
MEIFENTRMTLQCHAPTTLSIIGDVGSILRATCRWQSTGLESAQTGNISRINLREQRIHFGLGAAAFGSAPEQAVQRLGESAVIDSLPWWTPAEKPSISRCEDGQAEMLTPFLIGWDILDSASASLDSSEDLPLILWYEQLLRHPVLRKTGAIAVEVVARIPARNIVDKYMYCAPLAQSTTLREGQLITDPHLIDAYFLRNSVRNSVPPDTVCMLVMVGVVVDPVTVAAQWGGDILQRGFYATPGIVSQATVIHHTHAAAILDPDPMDHHPRSFAHSIEQETIQATQMLTSGTHAVSLIHIESDTQLSRAVARIGVIEHIKIKS